MPLKKSLSFILLLIIAIAIAYAVVYAQNRKGLQEAPPETHTTTFSGKAFPDKPPLFFSGRSLARFCKSYGLDAQVMTRKLTDLGIETRSDWTIKRIAEKNDTESLVLFEAIRQIHLEGPALIPRSK